MPKPREGYPAQHDPNFFTRLSDPPALWGMLFTRTGLGINLLQLRPLFIQGFLLLLLSVIGAFSVGVWDSFTWNPHPIEIRTMRRLTQPLPHNWPRLPYRTRAKWLTSHIVTEQRAVPVYPRFDYKPIATPWRPTLLPMILFIGLAWSLAIMQRFQRRRELHRREYLHSCNRGWTRLWTIGLVNRFRWYRQTGIFEPLLIASVGVIVWRILSPVPGAWLLFVALCLAISERAFLNDLVAYHIAQADAIADANAKQTEDIYTILGITSETVRMKANLAKAKGKINIPTNGEAWPGQMPEVVSAPSFQGLVTIRQWWVIHVRRARGS